jgi:KUP system potassium uptake protein
LSTEEILVSRRPTDSRIASGSVGVGVAVAALGVTFGDIGTSPLYALQTVFASDHGAVLADPTDVYGVISFVFWSITVVVSMKYVGVVLRADNDGEGGVLALAALVRRGLGKGSARRNGLVMALGVLGASLFYGDSVITPAISVLSAVDGVKVATPGFSHFVLPVAVVIIAVLFTAQRWGTGLIGAVFGPVMTLWFTVLAVIGLREVIPHPGILRGLSPSYAVRFVGDHPYKAFVAMGAIVLVITGAEALYADLGHFGPAPIRRAWFALVFPALTLNYLAQGALILRAPSAKANPFFLLVPGWGQIPLVVLATLATVIASQAVITGAFSVSRQAVRLGFLPHLQIRHTSSTDIGRIYVPTVNWALFAAVLAVMVGFGSPTRLATAYGVAVTGTFLITTALLLVLAHTEWHWPKSWVIAAGIVFGGAELTFFAANMTKIARGGWLPLCIAVVVFTVMVTWQRGRALVSRRRAVLEGSMADFIRHLKGADLTRTSGVAVFPHAAQTTAPLALRLNVTHNHVLQDRTIIISAETADVPHVPAAERLCLDPLPGATKGLAHVTARFGFEERTDIVEALRQSNALFFGGEVDVEDATYFVSKIVLRRGPEPGMSVWRKRLFIALARNASNQADYLCLPPARTVIMGSELEL